MFKKISHLSIVFLLIVLSSCKEETPPIVPVINSDEVKLSFKFNSRYKGFETQWNDWNITNAGDTIKLDKVKYILSNFILEKTNGTLISIPNSYAFLSMKDKTDAFSFNNVPKGSYKSIRFSVGVDSLVNHGNPQQYGATHPLNPAVNDMFWSWSGGYIFNVVEGYFKNKGSDAGFSFHVALDVNKRNYSFIQSFEITKDSKFTFDVNMDKYFSNSINYSLKTDGSFSHSAINDPIMTKFLSNANGVLSLNTFE